jgi:hypothetical protein
VSAALPHRPRAHLTDARIRQMRSVTMARERLSRLQRRILAWLVAENRRTRSTMAASHDALVHALAALGFDKGNISPRLTARCRRAW